MKILVTGGSGSIGRAVCRKFYHNGHDIVVLSRDPGKQLVSCPGMTHEVGCIEDEHFVHHIVRKHEVQAVIHTAANKYIGVCEDRPSEAVEANVLGSLNVLKAMESCDVKKGVFVSTDKACNRNHVYGITKYLMEKMVAEYGRRIPQSALNSVRFGNIFGSAGSVIPIWEALIDKEKDIELRTFSGGAPATRLAMLPSEAAEFIYNVFNAQGIYKQGAVLMKKDQRLLNMRTLAEVMTRGTRTKIREVPPLSMEAEWESLYSPEEGSRLSDVGGVLELGWNPCIGNPDGCVPVEEMDRLETWKFYKSALNEAREWI